MRKPLHPISQPIGIPPIGDIEWCDKAGEYAFFPRPGNFLLTSDLRTIQQEIVAMNGGERGRQMAEDRENKEKKAMTDDNGWIDPKTCLPGIGEKVAWKMKNTGTAPFWTTSGYIRDDGRIAHSGGCGVSYPSLALGWQVMPKEWIAIEHSMPGVYETVEWRLKSGKAVFGDCGKSGTINTPDGKAVNLHDVDAWRKR